MDCKEQKLTTYPAPEGEILPDHFYQAACGMPNEWPAEGVGVVFEKWNCNLGGWAFTATGTDFEPPDEEIKFIKMKPTKASMQRGAQNGLIYPEFRPSSYVELSEWEIEMDMLISQFFELRAMKLNRQLGLWRLVIRDSEQTFFACNAFVAHLPAKFPGGDGDEVATLTMKLQLSGPIYWDRLFPAN